MKKESTQSNQLTKIIQESNEHLQSVADKLFETIKAPKKPNQNLMDKINYQSEFLSILGDKVITEISESLVNEANVILEMNKKDLLEYEKVQLKEKLTKICQDIMRDKISKFNSKF